MNKYFCVKGMFYLSYLNAYRGHSEHNFHLLQIFKDWNLCCWTKESWFFAINWPNHLTIVGFLKLYYAYMVLKLWFWAHSTWSCSKILAMVTNSSTYIRICLIDWKTLQGIINTLFFSKDPIPFATGSDLLKCMIACI